MKIQATILLAAFGCTAAVTSPTAARIHAARQSNSSPQPLNASINEIGIRRHALSMVAPLFPDESVRLGHEGVAVAGIQFAPTGQMERVEILEAPDSFIAASMREALSKWTLRLEGPTPPRMSSKATYYFVISSGKGAVFAPAGAPLAHEWNARTTIIERRSTRAPAHVLPTNSNPILLHPRAK